MCNFHVSSRIVIAIEGTKSTGCL